MTDPNARFSDLGTPPDIPRHLESSPGNRSEQPMISRPSGWPLRGVPPMSGDTNQIQWQRDPGNGRLMRGHARPDGAEAMDAPPSYRERSTRRRSIYQLGGFSDAGHGDLGEAFVPPPSLSGAEHHSAAYGHQCMRNHMTARATNRTARNANADAETSINRGTNWPRNLQEVLLGEVGRPEHSANSARQQARRGNGSAGSRRPPGQPGNAWPQV